MQTIWLGNHDGTVPLAPNSFSLDFRMAHTCGASILRVDTQHAVELWLLVLNGLAS